MGRRGEQRLRRARGQRGDVDAVGVDPDRRVVRPAAATCTSTGPLPGSSTPSARTPRARSARQNSARPCATPDVITIDPGSAATPRNRPR